jgi:hypothetical protein
MQVLVEEVSVFPPTLPCRDLKVVLVKVDADPKRLAYFGLRGRCGQRGDR